MRTSLPAAGPAWLYLCDREHWQLQAVTTAVGKVDGHHEGEADVSPGFPPSHHLPSPSSVSNVFLIFFSPTDQADIPIF